MDYTVNYDELNIVINKFATENESLCTNLKLIADKIDTFTQSDSFTGAAATNIKSYFEVAHKTILASLQELHILHYQNCVLYKNDYTDLDNGFHTVIVSEELSEYEEKLKNSLNTAGEINDEVLRVLKTLWDIFPVNADNPKPNAFTIMETDYSSARKHIEDLNDDIVVLENKHCYGDFDNTEAMISALTSNINALTSTGRNYKLDFSREDYIGSGTFTNLLEAYKEMEGKLDAQSEAFNLACERAIKLAEEAEAEQARRESIGDGIMIVVVVAGVAVTVCTAGLGTGVAIGVAAATGAVTAGAGNLTDQYKEHGNIIENADKIDFLDAGVDTVIAGATGAVTAGVGAKVSSGLKAFGKSVKPVSHLGQTTINQVTSSVGVSVISRTAKRATSGTAKYLTTGSTDGMAKIFNPLELTKDVGLGMMTGSDKFSEAVTKVVTKDHAEAVTKGVIKLVDKGPDALIKSGKMIIESYDEDDYIVDEPWQGERATIDVPLN